VPVASVRAGYIPGTHAVSFDGAGDTIRLEHRARNRRGFAEGALLAARWIAGRKGFYDFREVVAELSAASRRPHPAPGGEEPR
jgi:4-hydroxy-tetrahydrodipicolinate reductase